jgi:hypothetical protein
MSSPDPTARLADGTPTNAETWYSVIIIVITTISEDAINEEVIVAFIALFCLNSVFNNIFNVR